MGFYKGRYAEIGEETFRDAKGVWTIGHVGRVKYLPECRHHYTVSIRFKPNLCRLPKASPWGEARSVFMRGSEEVHVMKQRIKDAIGYTPTPDVLRDLWRHFAALRDAYEAEDAFYASQDKEMARRILAELKDRAVARFESGKEARPPRHRFDRHRPPKIAYLTETEYRQAVEAQKVLNGHAYVEPFSLLGKSGHLADFNERIQARIDEIIRRREMLARQEKRMQLRRLLDTDLEFRRLVANAMSAAKESRAGSTEYELAYRYFGYASSLDEYRKINRQFSELMARYGLETYDAGLLVSLGREYLADGEMLPAPAAPYERPEGYFYQDWICAGNRFYQVTRVGRLYVYVAGDRLLKSEVRPFIWKEPPEVNSLEAAIYDHLVWLHNAKFVPYAYEQEPAEVVKALMLLWRKLVTSAYQRRIQNEKDRLKKQAARIFFDAIRCAQLMEYRDRLLHLSAVQVQPQLPEIEREIQRIAAGNTIARALIHGGPAAVV